MRFRSRRQHGTIELRTWGLRSHTDVHSAVFFKASAYKSRLNAHTHNIPCRLNLAHHMLAIGSTSSLEGRHAMKRRNYNAAIDAQHPMPPTQHIRSQALPGQRLMINFIATPGASMSTCPSTRPWMAILESFHVKQT